MDSIRYLKEGKKKEKLSFFLSLSFFSFSFFFKLSVIAPLAISVTTAEAKCLRSQGHYSACKNKQQYLVSHRVMCQKG